jgi:hypothetical protein
VLGLAFMSTVAVADPAATSRTVSDAPQVAASPAVPATPPAPAKRRKLARKAAAAPQAEVRLDKNAGASPSPPPKPAPLLLSLPPASGERGAPRNPLLSGATSALPPTLRDASQDAPLQSFEIAPSVRN